MPDTFAISQHWPALPDNASALNFETSRLGTFRNWTHPVSAVKLAKDGFSATGQGDEVQCFCCRRTHRGWTPGQNPRFVHSRLSPHCPMVSGTVNRIPLNIPIPVRNPTSVILTNNLENFRRLLYRSGIQESGNVARDFHVNTFLGIHLRNQPTITQVDAGLFLRRNVNVPFTAQPDSAYVPQHAYVEFSSTSRRQLSFTGFPIPSLMERLVIQGFFYVGHSDIVVCYSCGLGLRNWQMGEDDPKIAHVHWRPSCVHLQNILSPAFIQRACQQIAIIGAAAN